MSFIKPTKDKLKLFLIIIFSIIIVSVLFILVNRFLTTKLFLSGHPTYYQLSYFFLNLIRYFVIAYLIMFFYKKKLSLKGEYYFIFKIVILLAVFSYLNHSFFGFIGSINPEIFFTNWINLIFPIVNIFLCYLLACIVYKFKF